jgi:hypothetical protein
MPGRAFVSVRLMVLMRHTCIIRQNGDVFIIRNAERALLKMIRCLQFMMSIRDVRKHGEQSAPSQCRKNHIGIKFANNIYGR